MINSFIPLTQVTVQGILRRRESKRQWRQWPVYVLRTIVIVKETHESDDFFIGQVKQLNVNRICLNTLWNIAFLFLNFNYWSLQDLWELFKLILILNRSYKLLVVLLDLTELLKLVHDLLKVTPTLASSSGSKEGSKWFENSEGPALKEMYFRFSLEEKMVVW